MDGMKVIFRDPEHSFTVDIPEEVLNFNAKVLEVRNGSLLVSFISTPDIFTPPFTGQCVVRVNPQILKEDVKAGDTVRVWFDGLVQEIYPPILPNVYRVVKEEQEPAEAYHQNEDSFYVVLSDYDDITFEDAADFLLSSTRQPDEENRFVIANLGVYTPECEVESAKVVVSAVYCVSL